MRKNLLHGFASAAAAASAIVGFVACERDASAAPPWVERAITLPRHDWAFDVGMGLGRNDAPSLLGPGINLEMGVGVTERLELGFRGGVRVGQDARYIGADGYGRLFDTETYGTRGDTIANPEFRIRGALVRTRVFELALEGRAYLPIEYGSRFGTMFAVPLNFHFGRWGRLETGVYIPIVFYDEVQSVFSVPARLWFQATDAVWLGPMFAIRAYIPGGATDILAGFGFGYQITNAIDFKAQLIFPHIENTAGARDFGLGAGLQFRIE